MYESFSKKGYWYLPSKEDQKIAGVLSYEPGEGSKLELFGSLNGNSVDDHFKNLRDDLNYDTPVIYGKTSDNTEFTLFNCLNTRSTRNFSAEFPVTYYSSDLLISGVLLQDIEAEIFDECTFRFTTFSSWLGINGFDFSEILDHENPSYDIKYSNPTSIIIQIDDSTDIIFEFHSMHAYSNDIFYQDLEIAQNAYMKIVSATPRSFAHLKEQIFIFRNFLSLATLSPINIDFVNFYINNEQALKESNSYIRNEVYFNYELYPLPKEITQRDFLFTYSLVSDVFTEILRKWFQIKDDIRPILFYLIESIQPVKVFKINNFLNIAQALEGYHRRFCEGNEHLNKIIEKLVKKFINISLVQIEFTNCKVIAKSAYDSRNYYIHLGKAKYEGTKTGRELYEITIKIRLLLVCCVLNEVGFDNVLINKMLVPGKLKTKR